VPPELPLRFVIWSWPADRIRGPLRDVRTKAARTPLASYCLAWQLAQFDPQAPVGLMGFSFGARVITGSLHLLAGGRLGRLALPPTEPQARPPVRAVLMTAALDANWLVPGHRHGRALTAVDRLLLVNNSCDRAMKWYPLLDRCRRPTPLGRWGLCCPWRLGPAAARIHQVDASCQLGPSHDFRSYLQDSNLMALIWSGLCCDRSPTDTSAAIPDGSAS